MEDICSVEGCGKKRLARGLCSMHYRRLRLHGEVGAPQARPVRAPDAPCSVDGCQKIAGEARGLCPMHYQRQRIRGDVGAVEPERQSHQGLICEVDGCDQPRRKVDWCAAHYNQWARLGEVRPFLYKWSNATTCRACGNTTEGSVVGRDFCSGRCRALWKSYDGEIPTHIACHVCGDEVYLGEPGKRVRRADSRFCDPCLENGERDRVYRQQNAEAIRAKKSAWLKANRDWANAQARKERRERPWLAADRQRRYLALHPDASHRNNQRRRARLADAFVADVNRSEIWERDDGICGICWDGADFLKWHLDHVIPISRNGTHEPANVQVAHPSCNLRKGARLPWEMAA